MLAKKTSKNQLTLPQAIVNSFKDVVYFDVTARDNKIILAPVNVVPAEGTLESIRLKMKKLGIRENDVAEAVKWARKRNR